MCVCYKRKKKKQGMKSFESMVVVLGPETSANCFLFRGTFIYAATALGAMRLPMATAYGVAIPIALLTMG